MISSMRAQLALFLAVAVGGTLSDQIHVQFDVLSYATPQLFGQPLWVPLVFGTAALLTVNSYGRLFRGLSPEPPRPSRRAVLLAALEFVAAYLATGLFRGHPAALTVGLALAWVAVVAVRPSFDQVAYGLVSAITGPLAEFAISSSGVFAYHEPDFARVPVWLPALYLHAAVLARVVHLRYFERAAAPLPQGTAAR
jgi:hypothetical protein